MPAARALGGRGHDEASSRQLSRVLWRPRGRDVLRWPVHGLPFLEDGALAVVEHHLGRGRTCHILSLY